MTKEEIPVEEIARAVKLQRELKTRLLKLLQKDAKVGNLDLEQIRIYTHLSKALLYCEAGLSSALQSRKR